MIGEARLAAIPEKVKLLLLLVVNWASTQDHVRAVVLVGSFARGNAGADSDVDLVLIVREPRSLIDDHRWCGAMGRVERIYGERWGAVDSVRVWYAGGVEVEYAIATPEWVRSPLDEGTARVLRVGYRVLLDPLRLLSEIALDRPEQGSGIPSRSD
jgi:predicted nucleotidyltransferase